MSDAEIHAALEASYARKRDYLVCFPIVERPSAVAKIVFCNFCDSALWSSLDLPMSTSMQERVFVVVCPRCCLRHDPPGDPELVEGLQRLAALQPPVPTRFVKSMKLDNEEE